MRTQEAKDAYAAAVAERRDSYRALESTFSVYMDANFWGEPTESKPSRVSRHNYQMKEDHGMAEQQMILGTVDVPTARVAAAGEDYCKRLASWQALQKLADEARETLIECMEEDKIEHFVLDKYDVTLKTTATTKIAVKTLPKPKE